MMLPLPWTEPLPGSTAEEKCMAEQDAAAALIPIPHRLPRWLRGVVWGVGLGLICALAAETGRVLLGRNLHTVLPGKVYRCAQQSGPGLQELIRRFGIRTIINLRGSNVAADWY